MQIFYQCVTVTGKVKIQTKLVRKKSLYVLKSNFHNPGLLAISEGLMEVMVAYHLKQESVANSPAKVQIPSILTIGHVGLMGMVF